MPINIPSSQFQALKDSFDFQWSRVSLSYLEIHLTTDLQTLFLKNYPPLIAKLSKHGNSGGHIIYHFWAGLLRQR